MAQDEDYTALQAVLASHEETATLLLAAALQLTSPAKAETETEKTDCARADWSRNRWSVCWNCLWLHRSGGYLGRLLYEAYGCTSK